MMHLIRAGSFGVGACQMALERARFDASLAKLVLRGAQYDFNGQDCALPVLMDNLRIHAVA